MSVALDRPGTLADLLKQLGDIPLQRIRRWPAPGTAKLRDVIRIHDEEDRLFELVDGVLVEKAMGFSESYLAMMLGFFIEEFLQGHNLGIVAGSDAMVRLAPGLVRIPDVCFVSWDRLPGGRIPREPVPRLAPNLAVEVLSVSNTRKEMLRKLNDYFAAGVELVWLIDPRKRTVEVYTAPSQVIVLREKDTLDGGDVLPGFRLPLKKLFERVEKRSQGKNHSR